MVVLTNAELAQLQIWVADIANIASKSTSEKIAGKPPCIEVMDLSPKSLGWDAAASGGKITISRDCLNAPSAIRHYLMAHELGHEEGNHPLITFVAGILVLVPILVIAWPSSWFHLNIPLVLVGALAASLALGFLAIFLYYFSMLFEWDADKRAARMIGVPAMIQGVTLIQSKRLNAQKYYQNKIEKLNGGSPSMWKW